MEGTGRMGLRPAPHAGRWACRNTVGGMQTSPRSSIQVHRHRRPAKLSLGCPSFGGQRTRGGDSITSTGGLTSSFPLVRRVSRRAQSRVLGRSWLSAVNTVHIAGNLPNPSVERTVNGGAHRSASPSVVAPMSAAHLKRWANTQFGLHA